MSGAEPLWSWSAVQLRDAVKLREVSPVAVIDSVAGRIDALDGALHAFCTPTLDQARRTAEELERRLAAGEPVGALAGVPVGIKDLISTRGIRTTSGSLAYRDFVPDEDDIVVERLRAADALIVGKTNASEFGYGATGVNLLFPATRNPWDLERTPGGSSAGSAVAVASGMVPLALGSDGGGSIRIPAAFCGVFGFKPSMGRVPLYPGCRDERYPGVSGWESVEHIGPLSRSVSDSALLLSVIAGPDPRDRHSIPTGDVDWFAVGRPTRLRVGYSPDLGHAAVDADVLAAIEPVLGRLREQDGVDVVRLELDWPDLLPTFEALIALETDLAGLRALISENPGQFGPGVRRTVSTDWTAEQFSSAVMQRKAAVNRMWRVMADLDVLLTPTVAVTAFDRRLDGPTLIGGDPALPSAWSPFSYLANFTGQPAASVPIGFSAGLPIGLQVIGRHLADQTVLQFCTLLEQLVLPTRFPRTPEMP